ncbi:MAG: PAS domain-containing protein [Thermoplasmata archaeon]|nr:PAS domain-containing protein [Thermoplasmata archaeon]
MKGTILEKIMPEVMDTMPLELTLTDDNDIIVFWNEPKTKIFHRADEILGTDIRKCHSEKSHGKLEKLLKDMRSGAVDKESMRINNNGQDILIEYIAMRDEGGNYLGCLEACRLLDSQD